MERNFIFENEKGIFDLIENKGVLIDIPNIPLSQRRFETKEIDGKNGTYTIDKKTYKDRYVTLKTTFQEKPILDIFDGTGGRLHINNEDAFYKVKFVENVDENDEEWKYDIDFTMLLEPFKYLREEKIIIDEPTVLFNPTNLENELYIKIYGDGDITLKINNETIALYNIESYIELDSEIQECYKGNERKNRLMEGDFPVFNVGENTISWTGNVSKIEIIPRWRCL